MKRKAITTTHSCISFMLIFAQCFGMLPVSGITEDCTCLKFQWTSKRTLYSLVFALSALLNVIFYTNEMTLADSLEFGACVTFLFFLVTVITVVIFIDIARKWASLMKMWTEVELAISSYAFPHDLRKKLITVTVTIMSAAAVEHSLFLGQQFKACCARYTITEEILDCYFHQRFDYVFHVIHYNFWYGVYVQILNVFSTISWNFMDLFIILVSLCLSARFSQVAKHVNFFAKKKEKDENIWRKLREDYTRLSILCENVDATISNIILLSFGNNIFIILVQLYYSLEREYDGVVDKIYYVYSFAFLIIRLAAVALYAATIDSESKKPAYYLNTLPHDVYNVEIERFLYQTKYETSALTGHKLFRVTKPLILRLAGAIVTYELVLIEFNGKKHNIQGGLKSCKYSS